MPLYESRKYAENCIKVKDEWKDSLVMGSDQVINSIIDLIKNRNDQNRPLRIGFDGWYNIDWNTITKALQSGAEEYKLILNFKSITKVYKTKEEIASYKKAFTDIGDPGFGIVNREGRIQDLLVEEKITSLKADLKSYTDGDAFIVFGSGTVVEELAESYDLIFYFDKTRQPILWEMWSGKLVPFGSNKPDSDYFWKEYYYCDYYLLDHQKEYLMPLMDFWVESISFDTLKLLPREAYDGIMQTLVKYPIKEVPIYQPGPWGAFRYKDLGGQFDVPGLECNAWNELAGPELSMLVDIGREGMLNMPTMNLNQYADQWLGKHIAETYPGLFPMDVWLDDGYFPKSTPAERISMPIHNHPSTQYVQSHFKEPIGRYETYYIAEAYEGANTWLGYKDDADLEEWERLCRNSDNIQEIPNWKDFIVNWESNVGDLYLIPPGTAHGHGGNQMVLEMDTCPSVAATEYSFFTYDFARPSWDDETKTMTGKPLKMHLEHSFDNDKCVRGSYVKENLIPKQKVIKWTKEYVFDRYASDPRMPFEVERYHFDKRADADTEGRFMNILTLSIGDKVTIRSKKDPSIKNTIVKWQSVLVPAGFGEYEIINENSGACTVVQMRWKKG